jgi:hypothetical protein
MPTIPLLRPILADESLTRGLGDVEARMLVEWLVDWVELLAETAPCEKSARDRVRRLTRRARAIGRFVTLWCHERSRGAALQLAAAERFDWPLPSRRVDAADLMKEILHWENQFPVG